jgi:hypothetical protein
VPSTHNQFCILNPQTRRRHYFEVPRTTPPEARAELERLLSLLNAPGDPAATLTALGIIGAALCVAINPRDARSSARVLSGLMVEHAARWQIAAIVENSLGAAS